jgi:mono/diheme cytochrome c family protein
MSVKKNILLWLFGFLILTIPTKIWAKFAHEECEICHGNRLGIGLAVFGKDRRILLVNPNTGKPLQRIEAICLSCHTPEKGDDRILDDEFVEELERKEALEEEKKKKEMFQEMGVEDTTAIFGELMLEPVDVGFRVIDLHETHPVGIIAKKVTLPKESQGFKGQENQLTCLGCHDHHPSNPNYMYLRWPTDKGKNISKFCAHCHGDKILPPGARRRIRRRRY